MPKFDSGHVVATPGAVALGIDLSAYLDRHAAGDWGDLEDEDRQANDDALISGGRIWSAYDTPAGRITIITEAVGDDGHRASTCVLLPDEY